MTERIRARCVFPLSEADQGMLGALDPRLDIVFEGADSFEWSAALDDPELEVLFANHPPPDLTRFPRLRWIQMASAGLDAFIHNDPWGRGITLTNGSGIHAVHMAEYVLGAVMLWAQRLEARLANRVTRHWDREFASEHLRGRRLRGRTVAIVGYGSLGREVARVLDALGMRIFAIKADPSVLVDRGWREPGTGDPDGVIPEHIAGPDQLAAVVAEADVVVLTLPATPRTMGMVDRAALTAMRPHALLVNVGRGGLVDQDALIELLATRRIGGAVLDVTTPEPLPPDGPLWGLPDTLVTPHLSAWGDEDALWHTAALLFAENLGRYVRSEPLLNVTSAETRY